MFLKKNGLKKISRLINSDPQFIMFYIIVLYIEVYQLGITETLILLISFIHKDKIFLLSYQMFSIYLSNIQLYSYIKQ